jgi:glycosyltransferase involved in cell wall biosynthesis
MCSQFREIVTSKRVANSQRKLSIYLSHSRRVDVVILTGASLAWNPRALKEAATLSGAGLNVVVCTANPDGTGVDADRVLARAYGFECLSVGTANLASRVRSRLGREVFRRLGVQNRWQLGYHARQLLTAARQVNARYCILHLEQALWVGMQLVKDGRRVGLDMEDWYSEDLLPEARSSRPLRMLRDLERRLLRKAAHTTCPSRAMGAALANEFGCPAPVVIYNAFPWSERLQLDGLMKDRRDTRRLSIHWFSQTVGPGRGLEDLVSALPLVEANCEIHLRGNLKPGFDRLVYQRAPEQWRDRIFFHSSVRNDELLSRIAEHDIGFAGEMKFCRSRDLTVTNKILQYLLAGLAVVASDTKGQIEVAEQAPEAIRVYRSGRPSDLADCLNQLLKSTEKLRAAKRAALSAAERDFCWERQQKPFLRAVGQALSEPTTAPRRALR